MALIKSHASTSMLKDAVVFDINDLSEEARRAVESAKRDSEKMMREAQAKSEAVCADAEKKGYKDGLTRGLEEGRKKGTEEARAEFLVTVAPHIQTFIDNLNDVIVDWESRRDDMLQIVQADVVRLACAIAGKIVHRQVNVDPSIVRDQLAEALAVIGQTSIVNVAVHPEDRTIIEESWPTFTDSISRKNKANVLDDPTMTRGGCTLTTTSGHIDARIETQLERIASALVPSIDRLEPRATGSTEKTK